MRKIIIRDRRKLAPFNEPTRELRVLNKPMWLHQRDVLAQYCKQEREVDSLEEVPDDRVETIAFRDNLFFDQEFIDQFVKEAQKLG
ncbi:MAG TPA: multidrug transporter, partial [Anaerolineae bacterium]